MRRWFGLPAMVAGAGEKYLDLQATADSTVAISSEALNFSSGNAPFSIIAWVNNDDLTLNQYLPIFSRGNFTANGPYCFILAKTTNYTGLEFIINGADSTFLDVQATTGIDGWHQVAVTYSGNKLATGVKIYVDGNELVGRQIWGNNLSNMNTQVTQNNIGNHRQSNYTRGCLSDVVVANGVLTQEEITEAYNNGNSFNYQYASFLSDIISWWPLNGNLTDLIGGHNGTSTSPVFVDFNTTPTAYVRNSGNDTTGELNNSSLPFLTINEALDTLRPVKAKRNIIDLGSETYASPTPSKCFDNVWFKGAVEATVNSPTAPTALTGGTRVTGNLKPWCNNIKVTDIGVDAGSDWCTASNSGNAVNALSIAGRTGSSPQNANYAGQTWGTYLKNLTLLGRDPDATFHALLLEYNIKPYFENIKAYYTVHGIVYKTTGGLGVNIEAYGNGFNGLIIKSDTYNPDTRDVTVNGYKYRSLSGSTGKGIVIDIQGPTINDVLITGADIDSGVDPLQVNDNGNGVVNLVVTDLSGNPITP